MSQIRKSASFRSRIPIRRTKLAPRRCYSPEPYKNLSTPSMFDQSHNETNTYTHSEQRINKQKMKRQRHISATQAHQVQHTTRPINDTSATRPKTIYSSSSYSSSDESHESESSPQVQLCVLITIDVEPDGDASLFISIAQCLHCLNNNNIEKNCVFNLLLNLILFLIFFNTIELLIEWMKMIMRPLFATNIKMNETKMYV